MVLIVFLVIAYTVQASVALWALGRNVRSRFWPGIVAGGGALAATGVAFAELPAIWLPAVLVTTGLAVLALVLSTYESRQHRVGSQRELTLRASRDPFVALLTVAGILLVIALAAEALVAGAPVGR